MFIFRHFLPKQFLIISTIFLSIASFTAHADLIPPTQDQIDEIAAKYRNDSITFSTSITVRTPGSADVTKTFEENGSVQSIIDQYKDDAIEQHFPNYQKNVSTYSAAFNLRGINGTLASDINNVTVGDTKYDIESLHACFTTIEGQSCVNFSSNLGAVASALSVSKAKVGRKGYNDAPSLLPTSESVWNQLLDWLKGQDGTTLLNQVADTWIAQTSIDPVAGNPNSFMAVLTRENFNLAANSISTVGDGGLNLFSVTPSYYSSNSNGFTVKDANLPLKWSYYFNQDNALFLDAPITYDQIQSAISYSAALGLGYSHTFVRNNLLTWALVPSIFGGVVGSMDLGAGTLLYDGAIASRLVFPVGNMSYGVTNDISYLQTSMLKIGDFKTPYDMNNVLTSNGVDATYAVNKSYSVGGFYTLTNVVSGKVWYIPNYNNLGVTFATKKQYQSSTYDFMTVSLGYMFGPHQFNGGNLAVGFNF